MSDELHTHRALYFFETFTAYYPKYQMYNRINTLIIAKTLFILLLNCITLFLGSSALDLGASAAASVFAPLEWQIIIIQNKLKVHLYQLKSSC